MLHFITSVLSEKEGINEVNYPTAEYCVSGFVKALMGRGLLQCPSNSVSQNRESLCASFPEKLWYFSFTGLGSFAADECGKSFTAR